MPDVASRNTPRTPAEHHSQIRKRPRHSKEDMFWEVLQCSNTEKRERKECWEGERQDKKENQAFVKDATEQMIKIMEEQTQLLKSLIMQQSERICAQPPLRHIQNSFPCLPQTPPARSFPLPRTT
ncbi:unnamed protein product [Caretta caretta]